MGLPRVPVADATTAVPSDFGILSPAATVVSEAGTHWAAGFSYESLDCGTSVHLSSICSAASGTDPIVGDPDTRWRDYLPFSIEVSFACTTWGTLDYEAIAQARLEAAQQKAIEHEFWTGELAKLEQAQWDLDGVAETFPNRFLASTDSVDVTPTPGTAVKPRYGLALLEKALGDCGTGVRGTIHATRDVASALNLPASNAVLKTPLGNTVIAGSGYTGSGPDGTIPSGQAAWMYATGPVTVRLGDITAIPGSNRAQGTNIAINEVKVYADRPAAATIDGCCMFGVLVDLSLDYS